MSGFLLVSLVGDSAFPGLQTSVRRGAGPVYSVPLLRRALPRQGAMTAAAPGSGVVLGALVGPPNLFTLLRELPHQQNHCASHESRAGDPCDSSTGDLLLRELPEFV